MHEKLSFDVAVIGSGPGGYSAAIRAAQMGAKVAIIENRFIGGVCLNVGCIPTKTLLASSSILDKVNKASSFGIDVKEVSFDLEKIIKRKNQVIEKLRKGLEGLIKSNKISIFHAEAKFLSQKELELIGKDQALLTAKNIIIASGSLPQEIDVCICDHKHVFNSTSILCLDKPPKSMLIIGGGYIGCEFASFFAKLNVKVTIVEALPSILATQNKSVAESLHKAFIKQGINILPNFKVEKVEVKDGHTYVYSNDQTLVSDIVLVSIGRKANTQDLNLEKANVFKDAKGFIQINDQMQTNVKNIYAIGDCAGKLMLAHVASHQALIAVNSIFGKNEQMDYNAVPSVIYTKPEIATVGIDQEKAKALGLNTETKRFPFMALGMSHALGEEEGFVQITYDKSSKIVIGAEVFGSDAANLISEITLAITNKLTLDKISNTIHAHPTLSESWMEVASLAQGFPLSLPPSL
ncbi:MAG: dihydrolipoyl dehydrogenase [Chlamydiae bacterium]|nr:dihydrolipoyl dehydrogenase [Chlamydiota bacterium]